LNYPFVNYKNYNNKYELIGLRSYHHW